MLSPDEHLQKCHEAQELAVAFRMRPLEGKEDDPLFAAPVRFSAMLKVIEDRAKGETVSFWDEANRFYIMNLDKVMFYLYHRTEARWWLDRAGLSYRELLMDVQETWRQHPEEEPTDEEAAG